MLLDVTMRRNPALIEVAKMYHQSGLIWPDSYVIDVDTFLDNAKQILDKANRQQTNLYFMLKQVGRNPYLAKELVKLGYTGCVAVDYHEAFLMMRHQIPLANIGHLVQIPDHLLKPLIEYGFEVMTVYSWDKLVKVNQIAGQLNKVCYIQLKVVGEQDIIYPGQEGGIRLAELPRFLEKSKQLNHIKIVGLTSFPSLLFQADSQTIEKTPNFETVLQAKAVCEQFGISISHVNLPSSTCCEGLNHLANVVGSVGEPGHGLSGSTPMHASVDLTERPCVVYVSEVSHHHNDKSVCFGGGYYRRGFLSHALVNNQVVRAYPLDPTNIDYTLEIDGNFPVGTTVCMAFRFQIFVTRSRVVLLRGCHKNQPEIVGIYTSLGEVVE